MSRFGKAIHRATHKAVQAVEGAGQNVGKYVAPSKPTFERGVKSIGKNVKSGVAQATRGITQPSTATGKKFLAQAGGVVGASLGDPNAGKGLKNALNNRPVTQGVGGPMGLAARSAAAKG